MKALLVYKKSTYDFYVNENNGVNLSDSDIKTLKDSHDKNETSINETEDALRSLGIDYRKTYRAESFDKNSFESIDLVIAVGGDGTFLEASRIVYDNNMILGVNSDPEKSYGHYCVANRSNILQALNSIVDKTADVQVSWRLSFKIDDKCYRFPAMNDLLIHHSCPAGLTRYIITVNDNEEEHFCSGLWVSSPSGSTGAIRSFGGPLLDDGDCALAYQTFGLNRSKKKRYEYSSGITNKVKIVSKMREGKIFVDGQHIQIDFPYNTVLEIEAGDCIRTVKRL